MSADRRRALLLWLLCSLCLPILWVMQLMHGALGSPARSINMAAALDACGNALFGGDFRMTISERTGLALIERKRWARIVAPCIDVFFGPDHCLTEARQWIAQRENTK